MLVLAEKGSGDDDDVELITAGARFRLVATMNPGGDFGKKEVCSEKMNFNPHHFAVSVYCSLHFELMLLS